MSFLSVGDIVPPFSLPTDTDGAFDLYGDDVAGNFIAILFCTGGISNATRQLQSFADHHKLLEEQGVVAVAVSDETQSELAAQRQRLRLPFELLSDLDCKLFAGYGISTGRNQPDLEPVTLLVRPNLHCLSLISDGLHAEKVLGLVCGQRDQQNESVLGFQPPILMVPDVLTRDDCKRLIEVYNEPDVPIVEWSEIEAIEIDRDLKTRVADYDRQDRIDHFITAEEPKSLVSQRLRTRLLPEMKKAFHYSVTTFEGLRIGCYEGERGGRAHGHRDNSLPDVAYRRFAVSINLNSEEFQGGEIRFPEFGPQRYKAWTGAALVFSCSLLHEALAVTRGRRLVLLAFLNGN